jgi:hypothetical protein
MSWNQALRSKARLVTCTYYSTCRTDLSGVRSRQALDTLDSHMRAQAGYSGKRKRTVSHFYPKPLPPLVYWRSDINQGGPRL